jgi:hypothetical protein
MMSSSRHTPEGDFAIYLDYGVDCFFGNYGDLTISERGMVFRSRWNFQSGTQFDLRVCAEPESGDDRGVSVQVKGLVVECTRLSSEKPLFEITVMFLDPPTPEQSDILRLANRPELMGKFDA